MKKFIDKIFTWGSETLFPTWCQSEEHWTSRFTDFLWVDCPCCLLFRGIFAGTAIGFALGALSSFVLFNLM